MRSGEQFTSLDTLMNESLCENDRIKNIIFWAGIGAVFAIAVVLAVLVFFAFQVKDRVLGLIPRKEKRIDTFVDEFA